jgi:uncharacterized protein YjbI with pentapeptide repeats
VGANFSSADLRGATLTRSSLSQARFVKADLRGAKVTDISNLYGADFTRADIRGAEFRDLAPYPTFNSTWTDAVYDKATVFPYKSFLKANAKFRP